MNKSIQKQSEQVTFVLIEYANDFPEPTHDWRFRAGRMADEIVILRNALQDILAEEVHNGNGPVKKYENPLTASLRNIALEALQARDG